MFALYVVDGLSLSAACFHYWTRPVDRMQHNDVPCSKLRQSELHTHSGPVCLGWLWLAV
jgi:hypothetical protein